MIRFVINRKTGEEKVIDVGHVPGDNPWEALADCLAKMIVEHGLLKNIPAKAE